MKSLEEHLRTRNLMSEKYSGIFVDSEEGVAIFPLWNLSGQMVGYQQYRPSADKKKKNSPKKGRYYTYRNKGTIAVWGVESFSYRKDVLVICEGIFDACRLHNIGIPSIAVLTSDLKPLREWLYSLGRTLYHVKDSHGSKFNVGEAIEIPSHRDDLGDMREEEVQDIFSFLV